MVPGCCSQPMPLVSEIGLFNKKNSGRGRIIQGVPAGVSAPRDATMRENKGGANSCFGERVGFSLTVDMCKQKQTHSAPPLWAGMTKRKQTCLQAYNNHCIHECDLNKSETVRGKSQVELQVHVQFSGLITSFCEWDTSRTIPVIMEDPICGLYATDDGHGACHYFALQARTQNVSHSSLARQCVGSWTLRTIQFGRKSRPRHLYKKNPTVNVLLIIK